MTVEVTSSGIEDLIRRVSRIEGDTDEAAYLAVNYGARKGRTIGAKQIEEEVNYPAGYLNGDRLKITKFATRSNPEAEIRGRDRATSLARFSTTKAKFGRQRGLSVEVTPGRTTRLDRGFFMRLRNGNVGLAVRVKKGERLRHSRGAKDLGDGLWLLYGPSVNQVFKGVAADIVAEVSGDVRDEFLRQFRRLNNGR